MSNPKGWIAVDLDGTLAHQVDSTDETVIGAPIEKMIIRVREWLSQGKDVRIFTSRVAKAENIEAVRHAIGWWCISHIGKILPITCKKDKDTKEIWDNIAIQVITNTGQRADEKE